MSSYKFGLFIIRFIFLMPFMSVIAQDEQPNFIFILTDDQSYGMLSITGNTIVQTPNIDALAKDGVLFTNAHVTSAICTPSRASILTSKFERAHSINFNSGTSMSEKGWNETYPMVFRKNGYYTGWIGKNHVPIGIGGYASGLMDKSFDYWYAGHGHLSFYPKERHAIFNGAIHDTQTEVISEGIEDFLSNEKKLEGAVQFISERPSDQPFMLSVNFNLPHSAGTSSMKMLETDDDIYKSLYRDIEISLPDYYVAKQDIETPRLPAILHHAKDRQTSYDFVDTPEALRERYIRQLQAMKGIDRLVGELRKSLKSKKLDKNTIIVFTSDHGLFMGQFGLGGKAFCYEKTTHVPLIIYDPEAKKSNRNKTFNALVQSIDIAPTLLSRAGIKQPENYQGRDLNPILSGQKDELRTFIFTENLWSTAFGNPRSDAIQNHEWKYIRYYKNENLSALKKIEVAEAMDIKIASMLYKVHDEGMVTYRNYIEGPLQGEPAVYEELYNLKNDPNETKNLAADTQFEKTLHEMRNAWKTEIKNVRGNDAPQVLRYTADSEMERGFTIEPK